MAHLMPTLYFLMALAASMVTGIIIKELTPLKSVFLFYSLSLSFKEECDTGTFIFVMNFLFKINNK